MKESSEAPPGGALREAACWLRTNGVNTDGAAAKVVNLTDYQKSTPWHLGEDRSRLTGVPKRSLCQKTPFKKCSDPVSADPIRPFPTLDQALRGHIYIYIYIYRERERERCIYIYICIRIRIYVGVGLGSGVPTRAELRPGI